MNHKNPSKPSKKVKVARVPGGTPPRGYRTVRDAASPSGDGDPRIGAKWEIDPKTAPLVALAFKMRAEGKSSNEIIKSLGELSHITKGHNANEQ